MNNIKSTLDEEIKNIKEELLRSEKDFKLKKEQIQSLEDDIVKRSSKILEANKLLVKAKSQLEVLKKDADKWQINFALEKQKNDELVLKNNKNIEEIKETEKRLITIQETINVLQKDLKEAEEKIILIELNPSHSNNKINLLNDKIKDNNEQLE